MLFFVYFYYYNFKKNKGTFSLHHNGPITSETDTIKISVSDGKHISIKTININIVPTDKIAPHIADKHTTMILNIIEGQTKVIRNENLAFVDDKSTPNEIIYEVIKLPTGKLYLRNMLLKAYMKFSQADIDLQNLK